MKMIVESLSGNCVAVIGSVRQIFNRFHRNNKFTLRLLSKILPDRVQYILLPARIGLTPGCRTHFGKVLAVGF